MDEREREKKKKKPNLPVKKIFHAERENADGERQRREKRHIFLE